MAHPIGKSIVEWKAIHGREMEWRDTQDPYLIWIAEVVFQQTRIEQGIGHYQRFIRRFPDVWKLAAAELDEVLKQWEGLGYYSRARNLHQAAQYLVNELHGEFPQQPETLMKLKGVGPYTARAIASFAFLYPTGVIDGNVLRVMSRVLGDASPVNQEKTRKNFQKIIDEWVEGNDSKQFNHGIMDLGASLCSPTKPACLFCPLAEICKARAEGNIHLLPVKEKKLKRKSKFFHFYLVFDQDNNFAIRKRPEKGLWGGLWEIPNEEVEEAVWKNKQLTFPGKFKQELKHVFTHFDMNIRVYVINKVDTPPWEGARFIEKDKIPIFAFSKAVLKILSNI